MLLSKIHFSVLYTSLNLVISALLGISTKVPHKLVLLGSVWPGAHVNILH